LEQWIKEHGRAVVAADFNSSAVAEHAWTSGHPVDWANIKVLSVAHNYQIRIVQEAFSSTYMHEYVNLVRKSSRPV
jgi:hypothetical protein